MDDLNLVALSPGEMPATQAALSAWCVGKVKALEAELADLLDHHLIAANNGWKLAGLSSAITRAEKRITYYGKVKDAIEAGYLIVPNFPVTVLAVRVGRAKQPASVGSYSGSVDTAKAQILPSGEGMRNDVIARLNFECGLRATEIGRVRWWMAFDAAWRLRPRLQLHARLR